MSHAIEVPSADERLDAKRLTAPKTLARGRVDWPYAISFALYHFVALFAFWPWLFSWTGLALALAGIYVFGTLGINLCYHRLLTHRSFDCPKWLEHFLAILGVCCLQDTPARWVGVHRLHHQHSDEPPDPHSPLVTFLWGHVGWLLVPNHELSRMQLYERYAKDLLRERFYMNLERRFLWVWINLIQWVVFFGGTLLVGLATTGADWASSLQFALSVLVWGVFVRTVVVWHITWSINSVTHLWGYRNYDTDENSRNNILVGFISNGEGWHNNHHAQPRAAAHGHKWWEFDVTYSTIQALQFVGLATKVVPVRALPPGRLVTNNQPVE
jgi:stearoyl-CoA desaturase (delta-9 desaturase)